MTTNVFKRMCSVHARARACMHVFMHACVRECACARARALVGMRVYTWEHELHAIIPSKDFGVWKPGGVQVRDMCTHACGRASVCVRMSMSTYQM